MTERPVGVQRQPDDLPIIPELSGQIGLSTGQMKQQAR
jgi:hypothetical protein